MRGASPKGLISPLRDARGTTLNPCNPIRSPNYFFMVDRKLWQWNWSKPGKTVNSGLFAILLIVTESLVIGLAFAALLVAIKILSMVRLMRIGLPVPTHEVAAHQARLEEPVSA